jgi:hypothetical protein
MTVGTIDWGFVIASEAKQSRLFHEERLDCFVASLLAMTEGDVSGLEHHQ